MWNAASCGAPSSEVWDAIQQSPIKWLLADWRRVFRLSAPFIVTLILPINTRSSVSFLLCEYRVAFGQSLSVWHSSRQGRLIVVRRVPSTFDMAILKAMLTLSCAIPFLRLGTIFGNMTCRRTKAVFLWPFCNANICAFRGRIAALGILRCVVTLGLTVATRWLALAICYLSSVVPLYNGEFIRTFVGSGRMASIKVVQQAFLIGIYRYGITYDHLIIVETHHKADWAWWRRWILWRGVKTGIGGPNTMGYYSPWLKGGFNTSLAALNVGDLLREKRGINLLNETWFEGFFLHLPHGAERRKPRCPCGEEWNNGDVRLLVHGPGPCDVHVCVELWIIEVNMARRYKKGKGQASNAFSAQAKARAYARTQVNLSSAVDSKLSENSQFLWERGRQRYAYPML